jgi:hypothetical protein
VDISPDCILSCSHASLTSNHQKGIPQVLLINAYFYGSEIKWNYFYCWRFSCRKHFAFITWIILEGGVEAEESSRLLGDFTSLFLRTSRKRKLSLEVQNNFQTLTHLHFCKDRFPAVHSNLWKTKSILPHSQFSFLFYFCISFPFSSFFFISFSSSCLFLPMSLCPSIPPSLPSFFPFLWFKNE